MTDVKLYLQDTNGDTTSKTFNLNWYDSIAATDDSVTRAFAATYEALTNDTIVKIERIITQEVDYE